MTGILTPRNPAAVTHASTPSQAPSQAPSDSPSLAPPSESPSRAPSEAPAAASVAADYDRQLDAKHEALKALFAGLDIPAIEVFASAPQHYRMRAEFRIWHEDDAICYAMFSPGQKASSATLQRIEQFAPACEAINALMPRLLAAASADPVLRRRWYQVEFLATLSGEMLVTMVYHRPLDDAWEAAARQLQATLGIHVIGRSRGQKRVLSQDFVTERLEIPSPAGTPPAPFLYRQPEGAFTQPNARMCERMIGWACEAVQQAGISPASDLLELYCGNGNFTLPLSRHFRQVLATEVSKTSVQAAQWNIQANARPNVRIARLSAEEYTQAMQGERSFRRLREQEISLADHDFSTVLVDPPRAGVDDATLALLQRFPNIVYISCNPHTLRANLDTLCRTHTIQRMALFDQFPFTPHTECGVLLRQKPAGADGR